jgi:hypothetical protein
MVFAMLCAPQTLGIYRLAWVRGYKYQAYLPNVHRYNEVVRHTGILSMLTHNHADYYIDALTEVDYIVSRAKARALEATVSVRFELNTSLVAAGEACVRRRSRRKFQTLWYIKLTGSAGFTTASPPNAGFASCYTACVDWGLGNSDLTF